VLKLGFGRFEGVCLITAVADRSVPSQCDLRIPKTAGLVKYVLSTCRFSRSFTVSMFGWNWHWSSTT
jgi:hypothetical protein